MTFKETVCNCNDIKNAYQLGLRALGNNSAKIKAHNTRKINGSVDIDSALKNKYPNDNRWDYVIGYNEYAYFVEVHPAATSDIQIIKSKFQWLKKWLDGDGNSLKEICKGHCYYWVYTNSVHIIKSSPQYKAAVRLNIIPIRELELD